MIGLRIRLYECQNEVDWTLEEKEEMRIWMSA